MVARLQRVLLITAVSAIVVLVAGLLLLLALDFRLGNVALYPPHSEPPEEKRTAFDGLPVVVDAAKTATLHGRITFQGPIPPPRDLAKEMLKDTQTCLKGRTVHRVWHVGDDRGLANVVVWLRAGTGKYFAVPADVAAKVQPVEIDIPHCIYEPDVVVVFPTRFDAATRRQVSTGQELILKNSSPVGHSASWRGKYTHGPSFIPDPSKQRIKAETGPPGAAGNEDLIQIACNVHPWMMAYAWAFDHPYATVSSGGRTGQTEFGTTPSPALRPALNSSWFTGTNRWAASRRWCCARSRSRLA